MLAILAREETRTRIPILGEEHTGCRSSVVCAAFVHGVNSSTCTWAFNLRVSPTSCSTIENCSTVVHHPDSQDLSIGSPTQCIISTTRHARWRESCVQAQTGGSASFLSSFHASVIVRLLNRSRFGTCCVETSLHAHTCITLLTSPAWSGFW